MKGKVVTYESGYGVFSGVVIEEYEQYLLVESEGTRFYLYKSDVIKCH